MSDELTLEEAADVALARFVELIELVEGGYGDKFMYDHRRAAVELHDALADQGIKMDDFTDVMPRFREDLERYEEELSAELGIPPCTDQPDPKE